MDQSCKYHKIPSWSEAPHDITFMVSSNPINVHRMVLVVCSPVFAAMFLNGMRESLSSSKVIEIEEENPEEFETFIAFLYPFSEHQVTVENIAFLARLADKYQVQPLRRKCEDVTPVEIENSKFLIEVAENYSLTRLKERCIDYCLDQSLKLTHSQQSVKNMKILLELSEKYTELSSIKMKSEEEIYALSQNTWGLVPNSFSLLNIAYQHGLDQAMALLEGNMVKNRCSLDFRLLEEIVDEGRRLAFAVKLLEAYQKALK